MGKVIGIIVVIIVIILLFNFFGGGLGGSNGTSHEISNVSHYTNTSNTEIIQVTPVAEENHREEQSDETDEPLRVIVEISVVENTYIYNNERITLDDFMAHLAGIEKDLTVEIKNDNAAKRAYDNLIKRLKEKKIRYIED